jgi:fluoroquinolone transport system permease protein
MSHFVVGLAGLLAGMVGGFLLLESREEGTAKAFLVTPISLSVYVGVLSFVLFAASLVLILFQGIVIGVALPPWPAFLGAALAGAPAAPAFALFIAAFADDKTAAVAYMKICAIAVLIPGASYFLTEPSQWLAALYPPYWAAKAYWVGEAGGSAWPLWALGGLLMSAIWVGLLGRLFLNAARK